MRPRDIFREAFITERQRTLQSPTISLPLYISFSSSICIQYISHKKDVCPQTKARWTLSLPQTSRANPVQCCSTHQKKIYVFSISLKNKTYAHKWDVCSRMRPIDTCREEFSTEEKKTLQSPVISLSLCIFSSCSICIQYISHKRDLGMYSGRHLV